jgi:hypothetical protein
VKSQNVAESIADQNVAVVQMDKSKVLPTTGGRDENSSAYFQQAYRELSEQHVVEVDVLERLKMNLSQLEDLHARLGFMLKEVSYLIKKS